MIHKIIITEGLDRSGKGTALEQLEIDYTAKGYTVRTIFTPSKVDISFQEQANAAYFEFVRFKQKLGAHINYDMFSFGALEMVRSILQAYSTHPEKHVILIDRFGLSNLIYGSILREDQFRKVFGTGILNLHKYIFGCIRSLAHYAPVDFCMVMRPIEYTAYSDDDENQLQRIADHQLKKVNKEYHTLSRILIDDTTYSNNLPYPIVVHKVVLEEEANPLEFYNKISSSIS